MSYEFYKVVHFLGVTMVLMGLGSLAMGALTSPNRPREFANRKFLSMIHGIGLLISVVAGFGLLARLGMARPPWPMWVYAKFILWIALGVMITPIYRKPQLGKLWWMIILLLATAAAYFARYKPA